MGRFIHWPGFFGGMALVALLAFGLRALSGMPFWGCFLIALLAILVNGWIATWEDERPGGFNDPNNQPPS